MKVVHNIFPAFEQMVTRGNKEHLLQQRARVIWFTGLSGSGKTTIACEAEKVLHEMGHLTMLLDGDNVRSGINRNLGFSPEDRSENIRRIAEASKLFLNCGIITFCCFVSPTESLRQMARDIIGPDDFVEIFINTPLEECERRDVKGLYARARRGEIADFTGISAPFEAPVKPDLEIRTEKLTEQQSVRELLKFVIPLVQYDGLYY